ncbi:hypothetical protein BO94DRAFT_461505 [Aspergillus sclerotioniger CBS 115572]|uniref:F-box domain-containing protein n=1 Tax=Aspergillus sclerotioniger CBS 115572 TaxID=1450535 RepID=A0A317X320_9EURO|nr:hypothetical protein BO94DRAFT_461505 [Aspergillus sclerotioniger CBS 115572]PWY91897.1 hypothetical protein BO94DRAFT_461505 [Aspergillus sclerotioniger CBS 115572]
MHSSSSTQWVLFTPELLEMILLQLDLRTLVASAQRVCRAWNGLIQGSSSLQEALFLKPIKKHKNNLTENTINPLLAEAFPAIFLQNEALFPRNKNEFTLADLDMIRNPEKKAAYLRPEASWRRMLIQQPPAFKLGIFCWSGSPFGYGIDYEMQQLKDTQQWHDGIRMEMLFEPLIFHSSLVPTFSPASIYWWGECSSSTILRRLQELGITTVPDIILCAYAMVSCTDSDSDFENDDQQVVDQIQAWYRNMGLQPKVLGDGWERTVYEKRGTWD